MPIAQKIKNLVHRDRVPEAPAAPAPIVEVPAAAPLNSQTLLQQRELLAETNGAALNSGLNNGNVYNNLAQEEALLENRQEALLEERALASEYNTAASYGLEGSNIAGNRLSVGAVRAEPTILQTVEKDVVVHERIHPVEKEEIQPIIYREREQLDVRQITQMMHETEIQPTLVEQRELPAETREAIVERGVVPENIILPTREVGAVARSQVVHAPIVEEVVRKTVIEEIQPVIERDIYAPTVILNSQPVYEKIIEAPTVYREVREVQELGTRTIGHEGTFGSTYANPLDRNLDGRVDALDMQGQNLSSSSYNNSGSLYTEERLLTHSGLTQTGLAPQSTFGQTLVQSEMERLPTGQVLPAVASSRPAYAYLPSNYAEQRPVFIGSASDYVRAANGLPASTLAHSKTLPAYTQQTQVNAPLAYSRQ